MSEQLLVDRRADGIVVLTLNDPDRRNAMSDTMTEVWGATIEDLRGDPDLRCVVVTGAGHAFSSGGNLDWIAGRGEIEIASLRDHMLGYYRTWLSIRSLEVPTVAAVNGAAVGAGLCLALACDLRYAADDAKLIAPFTRLGLHPGMAATYLLPDVAGVPLAREMLLTGRVVTGAQAAPYGLVNRSMPREEVLGEALRVAGEIAVTAPIATRLTKAALAGGGPGSLEEALRWESLAQPVTMASADLAEGIAAQREKRAPKFTGR
jgi:enoyl-CoA hydratase/carnithine racemase